LRQRVEPDVGGRGGEEVGDDPVARGGGIAGRGVGRKHLERTGQSRGRLQTRVRLLDPLKRGKGRAGRGRLQHRLELTLGSGDGAAASGGQRRRRQAPELERVVRVSGGRAIRRLL